MHRLEPPSLRELAEYWNRIRGMAPMPSRADLDPLDIPRLLPILALVDVLSDPLRFRYRLVGTRIVELAGRDVTGQVVERRLYGRNTSAMLEMLTLVASECAPLTGRNVAAWPDREWSEVEWVALPLGADRATVDMVVIGVELLVIQDRPAQPPPRTMRRLELP